MISEYLDARINISGGNQDIEIFIPVYCTLETKYLWTGLARPKFLIGKRDHELE